MVAQADLCGALRYLLSLYGSSRQPFVTPVKSRDSNVLRIHSVFSCAYVWSLSMSETGLCKTKKLRFQPFSLHRIQTHCGTKQIPLRYLFSVMESCLTSYRISPSYFIIEGSQKVVCVCVCVCVKSINKAPDSEICYII